jgi:ribosomal-protein-alanine N-acetyltransferase
VILRPAIPTDLPAIAEIQAACPEASQWNPPDYFNYNCWVAEKDRLCGFIVTRPTAPGESELLNLAVAPDCRRGGVGRALLDAAMEAAPGAWFLEVRESNAGAIRLYENAGFRVCGKRPAYYSDPCEAGIVMSREK